MNVGRTLRANKIPRSKADECVTVTELDNKLEDFPEEESSDTPVATETSQSDGLDDSLGSSGDPAMDASFMSESIYEKLPTSSPKSLRHRSNSMRSYQTWTRVATDAF